MELESHKNGHSTECGNRTRPKNKLAAQLKIIYPVIQAPTAGGATTPELVAAVSNAGGLGSLAAGYLQPKEIEKSIKKIRELTKKPYNTTLTRAFSGKLARGIKNKFITRMKAYENNMLPYPIQHAATLIMRKEAARQNNVEFMSLWAGQFACLSKDCSAAQLMQELITQVNRLLSGQKLVRKTTFSK